MKTAGGKRIGAIAGDLAGVEEMYALKELMGRLGSVNIDARQDGAALDPTSGRASYLFNATIAGIEQADALLIIGSNPRREAAVLNARIRKRWRAGNFPVGLIGEKVDLTYTYDYLGAGAESLANLGKSKFAEALKAAERPLILIGAGALARPDGAAIAALAAKAAIEFGALKDGWNGYSVLHSAASRVARSTSASCRAPAVSTRRKWRRAASTCCSCSAPTRSTSRPGLSSSISAPMATAAPIAPT